MAGKAVVKAVVKTKATGKAVAKAVKKPVVAKAVKPAKAVAKKPTGAKAAKFNFNKLIMLIIRDVPKKGKKMTGGYKKTDIDLILTPILNFLNTKKNRDRIIKRIEDVYAAGLHDADIVKYKDDTIKLLKGADFDNNTVKKFLNRMVASNGTDINSFTNELKDSLKYDEPGIVDKSEKDKRFHNFEFINIVIELCNIYIRYYNNAYNTAASEKIKLEPVNPPNTPNPP
jgi:hypothetical protein